MDKNKYYLKYLKYKNKYLNLKNIINNYNKQIGGNSNNIKKY